jgi:hypothetical protein
MYVEVRGVPPESVHVDPTVQLDLDEIGGSLFDCDGEFESVELDAAFGDHAVIPRRNVELDLALGDERAYIPRLTARPRAGRPVPQSELGDVRRTLGIAHFYARPGGIAVCIRDVQVQLGRRPGKGGGDQE